jgi:hypothetical protein
VCYVLLERGIVHKHVDAAELHRIVVHDDRGFEFADGRDRLDQRGGEIETAAFPISRQVLSSAVNRSVGHNPARAADANEGRQVQFFFGRGAQEAAHHLNKFPARHHPG